MAREKLSSGADMPERWMSAALELNGLLAENDALLQQRALLRRKRTELFRQILEEARTFVEGVNLPPPSEVGR